MQGLRGAYFAERNVGVDGGDTRLSFRMPRGSVFPAGGFMKNQKARASNDRWITLHTLSRRAAGFRFIARRPAVPVESDRAG